MAFLSDQATDNSALVVALVALGGVIVGAIISAIATWRIATATIAAAHEGEKYRQRLAAYQSLWSQTQRIRRTPEDDDRSIVALKQTLDQLDAWYFQTGGLLLTDDARKSYFALLGLIQERLSLGPMEVSENDYSKIFQAATDLRRVTATEVLGRTQNDFRSSRKSVATPRDTVF